jgi:hypothetical protein
MKANYRELLPYGVLKSVLFFAMKELVGIIGSILKMNVNNDFGLTLKNAVFTNILRQDTEFFDKKQAGVLQVNSKPEKYVRVQYHICSPYTRMLCAPTLRVFTAYAHAL